MLTSYIDKCLVIIYRKALKPRKKTNNIIGMFTPYGNNCIYKKEWFIPVKYEFNGEQFIGPKDYDNILKETYGDYLTPPPEDKRYGHPNVEEFWKD